MKKALYLLSVVAVLCCVSVSCEKENTTKNPANNDPVTTKLVSKVITVEKDSLERNTADTLTFIYDNQNRVVSVKRTSSSESDWMNFAYTYSGNSVACSITGMGETGTLYGYSATAMLNADGYIMSGTGESGWYGEEEGNAEERVSKKDNEVTSITWTAKYNNKYLANMTTNRTGFDLKRDTCTWSNDNMTSIKTKDGVTIAQYNTNVGNFGNLDMNWLIYSDECFNSLDEYGFAVLGLYGKRSKNLVLKTNTVAYDHNNYEYNFSYKYDKDGNIVELNSETEKVRIEYKYQ